MIEPATPGASLIQTQALALTARAVAELNEFGKMGVIHGQAGLGKTLATRRAASGLADTRVHYLNFPPKVTPRQVAARLISQLMGERDPAGTSEDLLYRAAEVLANGRHLLIVDEAQNLEKYVLESLRWIHDRNQSRLPVVFVGGDGCWNVIRKRPMLKSRIYWRVPFRTLTEAEVLAAIPKFHSLFDVTEELILRADRMCTGHLRDWDRIAHKAYLICTARDLDRVTPEVIDAIEATEGLRPPTPT